MPGLAGPVLAVWDAAILRHVVEPSSTCAGRRLAGSATTVNQSGFMIIYEDRHRAPPATVSAGQIVLPS
jgi:hypothetical protein